MAHALLRAASALVPTPGPLRVNKCREESRHGTQECVRHVLRDYVNATVGFQALEEKTDIPAKSLMRMLGPKGSPSAANLAIILTALQKSEGVHFELSLKR